MFGGLQHDQVSGYASGMQHHGDFNHNRGPHCFVEYKAISNNSAVVNRECLDIHHTKKQAVHILSSCSFLFLKTLFHFISQCILAPYLESGLSQLRKELDNCNFQLQSQEADLFIKAITMHANIKLLDLLACFYHILNALGIRCQD